MSSGDKRKVTIGTLNMRRKYKKQQMTKKEKSPGHVSEYNTTIELY